LVGAADSKLGIAGRDFKRTCEQAAGKGRHWSAHYLERRQKKARSLPTGPWKFWERMPERHCLYDPDPSLLQVRSDAGLLRKLQLQLRDGAWNGESSHENQV
jgi:hypothetical protein